MLKTPEDPRKRVEYVELDVIVNEANRIPPERLKNYKPFIGFRKQPPAADESSAAPPPPEADTPPADDKPVA